ncbi:MAG: FGGY-family carbohydrate kinase [Gaiellaceae bacterium MAG52_C11]|nr:FGGY-family carbohydrate kinase [Candidatus Gaiellasilicea maunaloa]
MRVLALDVGTSSARTRVYDERAECIPGAGYQERYTSTRGHSGRLGEFDADELVAVARDAMREARRGLGAAIDAVAISSFWHSLVCLDRSGRPITPLLTWRQLDVSAEVPLDSAAVHARTGCPLHPSFWPMKIAGLKASGVRPARYVSFSDLLTDGRTSLSMASGTGLLGLDGRWDRELLEALGVREEQLPELADELVLGDGAAATLGSGVLGRERAALTIGTSGALRTVHEPSAPRAGLFLYRLDDERVCEGGSISDGGNLLDWLGRLVGPVETAGLADEPSPPLDFLTLLGGERSPGWNAGARGIVAGLSFETTPRDLVHAALEGVAYRLAEIGELLPEVAEIVGSGGALLHNPDWAQVLADVLERPVTLSAVDEASARGAAVLALERLGVASPPAPLGRRFEPRPERFEEHRAARERQRLLKELAGSTRP